MELASEYGARYIQIDSVCGHLDPKKDIEYGKESLSISDAATVFDVGMTTARAINQEVWNPYGNNLQKPKSGKYIIRASSI